MIIKINKDILNNFTMKNTEYVLRDLKHYLEIPGKNEYRLYSYLSTLFSDCVILDIGTKYGNSALSFSHNSSNKIISYDIVKYINDNDKIKTKENIEFKIGNILDDLDENYLKNVKIIMIDIDHLYETENKILTVLKKFKYDGIIILDDIHHHKEPYKHCMEKLWFEINENKYDLTEIGHDTGTGIILFTDNITIDLN